MAHIDNRGQHNYGIQYNAAESMTIGFQPNLVAEAQHQPKRHTILFLGVNPKDILKKQQYSLRLDEEMREIDAALHRTTYRDLFVIQQQWAVTVAGFQEHFLRHKPTIVHFSGHGSLSGAFFLEDSDGNKNPIPPSTLSQVFSLHQDAIRCVVLNACYSEKQAQAIAQHVDCVVGMAQAIGDKAAIAFARAFYQALGYGGNIEAAFKSGCIQINLEGINEQNTPKLLALRKKPQEITFVDND
ncbi:MAG TPA: CHAT domain-containing protein [Ktedonobacteraceae bacterium]|nr:CHAT domain-containing protein [Ktedonobacteraceae bacterium]